MNMLWILVKPEAAAERAVVATQMHRNYDEDDSAKWDSEMIKTQQPKIGKHQIKTRRDSNSARWERK